MIVVDASVMLSALVDSGASGALARRVLEVDDQRHAPGLLDVEVLAGVRGWWRAGNLSPDQAASALIDLEAYPIVRHPERALTAAAFELRQNVTAYDAVYVVLAAALGAVLVTADRRLARAPALPCDVRLLDA